MTVPESVSVVPKLQATFESWQSGPRPPARSLLKLQGRGVAPDV